MKWKPSILETIAFFCGGRQRYKGNKLKAYNLNALVANRKHIEEVTK